MVKESFEVMLKGGHPNSLGRTVEVVDIVLANPDKLEDLYNWPRQVNLWVHSGTGRSPNA